jgi:cytoskeletal protein RodZ
MAGTSMAATAALVVGCGLAVLVPTAALAQIPFMIPNFNFGPQQHYRSGSSHYSTRSRSRHEEDKTPDKSAPAPDKSKERDATQPEPTASTSAQRTQQTSGPPPSRDAAPSGGAETSPPAAPAKKPADDQPAFQPSR